MLAPEDITVTAVVAPPAPPVTLRQERPVSPAATHTADPTPRVPSSSFLAGLDTDCVRASCPAHLILDFFALLTSGRAGQIMSNLGYSFFYVLTSFKLSFPYGQTSFISEQTNREHFLRRQHTARTLFRPSVPGQTVRCNFW